MPTTNFYLLMLLHILYMPPAVRCGAITEGRQRQHASDATTEGSPTERGSTPQTSAAICMTTSLLSYDFHSVSRGCEAPRHNKGEKRRKCQPDVSTSPGIGWQGRFESAFPHQGATARVPVFKLPPPSAACGSYPKAREGRIS